MTPDQFRAWREERGLTMTEAALLLSEALERTYRASRIGEWERGEVPVPSLVRLYIKWEQQLRLQPRVS